MSWVRWNSRCIGTDPPFACNMDCNSGAHCPGSSVFVFEGGAGLICAGCHFERDEDFVVHVAGEDPTPAEEAAMMAHLLKHHQAGHHVRPSLLPGADLREATNEELQRWLIGKRSQDLPNAWKMWAMLWSRQEDR